MFDTTEQLEYYVSLKKSLQERLKYNLGELNNFESIDRHYLFLIKPDKFQGSESAEIMIEKEFDYIVNMVSQHTNKDPKKMTVREFYSLLEYIKKNGKRQKSDIV